MRRPLLIFDGDCGFCRRWVERWRELAEDVDFEPSQAARTRFPKIPAERFDETVLFVEPDGRVSGGALAVFRLLARGGRPLGLWLYERVPLFRSISEAVYVRVARHRTLFSRASTLLWGPDLRPASTRRATALFLRALALCYLCAFASLYGQIDGLLGPRGILPAARYLAAADGQLGASARLLLPSVLWLGASTAALKGVCAAGAAGAAAALAGLAVGPALFACWGLYLSIVSVGQEFLSFQWDILLLEAGFLALLVAPWTPRARADREPPAAGVWLLRWLLARLMLESGLCKLASGDAAWRSLTALQHHYLTQPLPTRWGWWAHQAPPWLQTLSCAGMFGVELAAPLLALTPRRPRAAAAAALAALQLAIALTGNYGFFNLLTLALCLTLLDDRMLGDRGASAPPARKASRVVSWAFAALSAPLSLVPLAGMLAGGASIPSPLRGLYGLVSPLHLVNGYGLFAVMTTKRVEIAVEGSRDGKEWRRYRFRFKPDALDEPPRWCAPHMPRLDWQMWFAALGSCRDNPWFVSFLARLAAGQPEASGLLAENPFQDAPPRYIRTTVAEYRFTAPAERRATGNWWKKTEEGPYCPILAVR